jgi:diguanylate cyclase (GGDEF)-like protein/PAS domain S-box-containing protein
MAEPGEIGASGESVESGASVSDGGPAAADGDEVTGIDMALVDALRPYLGESLMVLDRDWTVLANFAPPGGLIGRGLGVGLHTLEDMHPDDALQVMDLGLQAFATEQGWQGSIIVRMHRGDGSYGRYEIMAVNQFDDPVIAGMVVRTREMPDDAADDFPGIEPRLAVATLAEILPIGVLLLDGSGNVIFANETACGMLGRDALEIKHGGLSAFVEPEDRSVVAEALKRVTDEAGRVECRVRFAGVRIERAECRFCSEGDPVTCVAVTIEDITQRWNEEQDLEHRANHDSLTGLLNRASLYDMLQARLDRDEPTTVAFIDLDGFKAVNDVLGHDHGDRLLIDVAAALVAGAGPGAHVGRIGGDEFVVVTSAADGPDLSARLEALVASAGAVDGMAVQCSVGIARSAPGDSLRDVVHRADEEMYEAKGRRTR